MSEVLYFQWIESDERVKIAYKEFSYEFTLAELQHLKEEAEATGSRVEDSECYKTWPLGDGE